MSNVGDLKSLEDICELYSNYLFGNKLLYPFKEWAVEQLRYSNDEDAILLASSISDDETIYLVLNILERYGHLPKFERNDEAILGELAERFPVAGAPSYVTACTQRMGDAYCDECSEVEKFYRGRDWSEIDLMGTGGFLIGLLTPEALHYYLPAILKAVLIDKDPNTDITDRFYYLFLDQPRALGLLCRLNDEQMETFTTITRRIQSLKDNYTKECRAFLELKRQLASTAQ